VAHLLGGRAVRRLRRDYRSIQASPYCNEQAVTSGSSLPIRILRDGIERVAGHRLTVLIEGAIGPEPHRGFIDISHQAAIGHGHGPLARAGKDGTAMATKFWGSDPRHGKSARAFASQAECDIGKPFATYGE
jgi:hypothetical protein